MTDHRDLQVLLGAYVLGGLDAADRARVDEHLRTCDECRQELASFAGIPGLLRKVPQMPEGADPEPSPDLLPTLLDKVRDERRSQRRRLRSRWIAAAAALVLAIAVGVGAGLRISHRTEDVRESSQTVALLAAAGQANGQVELVHKTWGTELVVHLTGLPAQGPFTLVVHNTAGLTQDAATWGTTPSHQAQVTGATSFATDEVHEVQVTGPDGTLLAAGRI